MAIQRPVGVCTWTFGDQSLADTAATLSKIGFDGVELLGDLSRYSAAEAKRILDDHGLQVFSLTPENVDISHPDGAVRQHGLDYFMRLLDFAAMLGRPLVSCHGLVGRIAPLESQDREDSLLIDSVRRIGKAAQARGLTVVFEVLNRYETHQVQTGQQALSLIHAVGLDNLFVLLDAYHMNIEEADPAGAIRDVGRQLGLFHIADSNRQGIGRGHTDVGRQLAALAEIGYAGPLILECTAPGPNPFTPAKAGNWRATLADHLAESLTWLQSQG